MQILNLGPISQASDSVSPGRPSARADLFLKFAPEPYLESELKIRRNAIEARKSLSVFSPDYIDHLPRQRPIH